MSPRGFASVGSAPSATWCATTRQAIRNFDRADSSPAVDSSKKAHIVWLKGGSLKYASNVAGAFSESTAAEGRRGSDATALILQTRTGPNTWSSDSVPLRPYAGYFADGRLIYDPSGSPHVFYVSGSELLHTWK